MPKSEGTKVVVVYNLLPLRRELEAMTQDTYTWTRIAREAELNKNTVTNVANNATDRVDRDTLSKLLNYLRGQGLEVTARDLLSEMPESEWEERKKKRGKVVD